MEDNNNNIEKTEKRGFRRGLQGFWDLIKFAVMALLIVIPIRMFIAQPFVVSGESMHPTFDNGEYLIVDELSYITGTPSRGDVVIFRYPKDTKRFFIKRVIGLPNEEVIIKNGKIKIVNEKNPNGFNLEEPYLQEGFDTTMTFNTGEKEYFVMGDNRNRSSDSRIWGGLPSKLIVGRAFLRLLPFDEIKYLPGDYKTDK